MPGRRAERARPPAPALRTPAVPGAVPGRLRGSVQGGAPAGPSGMRWHGARRGPCCVRRKLADGACAAAGAANLSFAALQLNADLGFSRTVFGFGSGALCCHLTQLAR